MRMIEIHLECEDLERSLKLYTALLPHDRIIWNGPTDPQAFIVLADGTALGLWEKGTRGIHRGQGAEHVHYAFQITE